MTNHTLANFFWTHIYISMHRFNHRITAQLETSKISK